MLLDDFRASGGVIANLPNRSVGPFDTIQSTIVVPVMGGDPWTGGGVEPVDHFLEASGLPVGVCDVAGAVLGAAGVDDFGNLA